MKLNGGTLPSLSRATLKSSGLGGFGGASGRLTTPDASSFFWPSPSGFLPSSGLAPGGWLGWLAFGCPAAAAAALAASIWAFICSALGRPFTSRPLEGDAKASASAAVIPHATHHVATNS